MVPAVNSITRDGIPLSSSRPDAGYAAGAVAAPARFFRGLDDCELWPSSSALTGGKGRPPSGCGSATYSKSGSSFHGPRTSSSCERLNTSLTVSSGGMLLKERIIQLAHGVQRLHEHIRVGNLAGEKVVQCLLGAFVVAGLDQSLVSLAGAASAEMFARRSRTTLPPSWM